MWWAIAIVALVGIGGLALMVELARRAPLMEETESGLRFMRSNRLKRYVLNWLGGGLQASFQDTLLQPLPDKWTALAEKLPPQTDSGSAQPGSKEEGPAMPSGSAPFFIGTAPREPDRTLLLFCPEQGGWQTGRWIDGEWRSTAMTAFRLVPTHWTTAPTNPET